MTSLFDYSKILADEELSFSILIFVHFCAEPLVGLSDMCTKIYPREKIRIWNLKRH